VTYYQGRLEEGLRYFSEGADILLEIGDVHAAAISMSNMAAIANEMSDFEQGVRHIRRALDLQRQLDLRRDLPSTLINLGEATRELGRNDESREAFAEAFAVSRDNGDMVMYALALHGLAVLEYVEDDIRGAAARLLESIELLAEMDDPHSMVENAHLAALLWLSCERWEDSAAIIAANVHLSAELGIGVLDRRQAKLDEMNATAREALGEERFAEAQAVGAAMDIGTLARRIEAVSRAIVGPTHAPVKVEVPEATGSRPAVEHRLTARELDILRLLAAGKSTSDMAGELFVSSRTITTHVAHVLEKLGVPNRTAAVAVAMREGLVREDRD
jgi:DNA-binding NarL/FixJ family response regulator